MKVLDCDIILRRLGLTAEQVRNSSLVRQTTCPTNQDKAAYDAARSANLRYKRAYRARNAAKGLTTEGKPRQHKRQTHPELRGLSQKEYHVRYKQLQRAGKLK